VWEYSPDEEFNSSTFSVFSLSSIKTEREKVEFVNFSGSQNRPNKIQQINIVDSLLGTLIKRIEFYYSETFAYPTAYIFLDSLKVFDKDLMKYEKYSFDYYDRQLDLTSTSLVPDQWGYNKTASSMA